MSTTFHALGLDDDLASHLDAQGITAPTPIQIASMRDLLDGRDVCAAAPTGSGKTLAFGLPLMARIDKGKPHRPAALVLTPTRELASQIHTVLADLGRVRKRWSVAVYGGVNQFTQVKQLRKGVDVLVATPGRLEDLIEQGYINLDRVSIVVVDEADRMSDMGFLPCVRRILDQCSAERQTMLFSATLDGAADDLAKSHMTDPLQHSVAAAPEDLSRSTHLFWTTPHEQRVDVCADVIRRSGRVVVFTRTKHGADRLTERLERGGLQVAVIHGGHSQSKRERSLGLFRDGRVAALVATDVAARGLHIDDVSCVVHYDLPETPTDYQHRSGRTARAGASGFVVSFVQPNQKNQVKGLQRRWAPEAGVTAPNLEALGEPTIVIKAPRVERSEQSAAPTRSYGADRPRPERTDRWQTGPTTRDRFVRGSTADAGLPATGRRSEPARTDRPSSDRPWNDRSRNDRPTNERPGNDRPGNDRASSDRSPTDRPWGDRPRSDRPWNDRSGGDRPRSDRPWSERPRADGLRAERPWGGRVSTDRPSDDRPSDDRPSDDRPSGDRPSGDRSWGERPWRDRPSGNRSFVDRSSGDRPWGDRPSGNRSFVDRPSGDRPSDSRPYGDRATSGPPQRPWGERSGRFSSDRAENPATPASRPARDDSGSAGWQPRTSAGRTGASGRAARPSWGSPKAPARGFGYKAGKPASKRAPR